MLQNKKIHGLEIFFENDINLGKIKSAINFLILKDRKNYLFVKKYLNFIAVKNLNGRYNEALVKSGGWLVSSGFLKDKTYPYQYLASLLIHGACHVWQHKIGVAYSGRKAETEAYKKQRVFLLKIGYKNGVIWLDNQYKNRWWVNPGRQKTHQKMKSFILEVETRNKKSN